MYSNRYVSVYKTECIKELGWWDTYRTYIMIQVKSKIMHSKIERVKQLITHSSSFCDSSEYRTFVSVIISTETNLHVSFSLVIHYERSGVWIIECTGCVFEKWWWVGAGAHTASAAASVMDEMQDPRTRIFPANGLYRMHTYINSK